MDTFNGTFFYDLKVAIFIGHPSRVMSSLALETSPPPTSDTIFSSSEITTYVQPIY